MPALDEPVVAREGWPVLHLFYAVDPAARQELTSGAGKDLARVLAEQVEAGVQLHLFSVIGHKADVMVMAIDADLARLRALQTAIATSEAGPALDLTWSYLSLTEGSEYMPSAEEEHARLVEAGEDPSTENFARRMEKFAERMDKYREDKLHPRMPEWELACFYPMSHRREGDDNWYSLPYEERRRLMHEHGRSGRAFTGRVLQLVSGSTGLDDMEWGVTLFAHDLGDLKEIVYRLRYDEASARYGEFGDFVIGIRRSPQDLVTEIGL